MTFNEIKQILKDGAKGLKMAFFASNRTKFGHIHKTTKVFQPGYGIKENVYLYENTVIHEFYKFITPVGKFIMRENSIAAAGLTVITFNHSFEEIGYFPGGNGWTKYKPHDVIVDEHVWLGANVTLCPGTHINRGVIVAAGAVCIKSVEYPPYSIVGGNPAKFIKFKYTLKEQIEHEKLCFSEEKRLSVSLLEENYKKYLK